MYNHFPPLSAPITQKRAGLIGPHARLLREPDASLQSLCLAVKYVTSQLSFLQLDAGLLGKYSFDGTENPEGIKQKLRPLTQFAISITHFQPKS